MCYFASFYMQRQIQKLILYQLSNISLFSNMKIVKNLASNFGKKQSELDKKMFRRSFQKHLDQVQMPHQYTGFTNRILIQEPDSKTINYFIPVYVIIKIKSIQDIDIQKLVGSISCVIIISVRIQNLPDEIVTMLQHNMNIQLNRSELIQLKESQQNNIAKSKKDKMLTFTLRKTVSGTIVQETLWSPFEIVRIIVSLTFNSIKKDGQTILHSYIQHKQKQIDDKSKKVETIVKELGSALIGGQKKQKAHEKIEFDSMKKYVIMFNSMRCGAQVPISYALGCSYSLYDLAQKKLESYHTHLDSYNQIIRKYEESLEVKSKDNSKKKQGCPKKSEALKEEQTFKINKQILPDVPANITFEIQENKNNLTNFLTQIYEQQQQQKGQKQVKPNYYQYTHIVIPLYKYPGNSLATIFIPIFLLALLSLAIFYQENELSSRIGSIATMVLGYIALIPSIKQQLPPSSKITIIEGVVYLSTLCCLLSLIESFTVDGKQDYIFVWSENTLFLLCLLIHSAIFIFILSLLVIHKLVWQKSYNYDDAVKSPDPEKENQKWINLYCDEEFFKVNNKIYAKNLSNKAQENKSKALIRKYVPVKIQQKPAEPNILDAIALIQANKPKEQISQIKFTDFFLNTEATTLNTETKPTQKVEKAQNSEQKVEKAQNSEQKVEKAQNSEQKVEKKSKDAKEVKDKEKGEKKPKKVFNYQKGLQYLDELITKGYHITLSKQKKQKKPVMESAKIQNHNQKKNQ